MRQRAWTGMSGSRRAVGAVRVVCDPQLAARVMGWLYVAGATIGLISLILPHSPRADVVGLYSNVLVSYLGGAITLVAVARFRPWMIHASLAIGSLLITRAVLISGETVSFYPVWYIWIGLYAFYFCSRRAAAAHVTFSSLLYAGTLAYATPSSPVARWLTTVATLAVAGGLIDTLVRRVRQEAAGASSSAAAMAKVTELAHELAGISESGPARTALCTGALRVAGADRVALWEPCREGTGLQITASAGSESPATEISFTGPPSSVTRAYTSGELTASGEETGAGQLAALWCPIVRDQRSAAILEISYRDAVLTGDNTLIALADLLAVEAGVTLVRVALLEELEQMARTDELTGLPNRRAWQEHLTRELLRAQRGGEGLAVAMIDLDHFKRYNDTYGHQSGDRLLKQVAGAWAGELRSTDILSRYGGEEFSLALPGCRSEDAVVAIDRLRAAVPDGQSCSAGVAIWDGAEGAADLLARADHALYRAKHLGRNRSVLADTTGRVASVRPIGQ